MRTFHDAAARMVCRCVAEQNIKCIRCSLLKHSVAVNITRAIDPLTVTREPALRPAKKQRKKGDTL